MRLDLLVFAMTAATSTPVSAADPALTIYRSDSDVLFEPGNEPIADGHAVVHEQRTLPLAGGRQTVVIDGLPSVLDTEAVAIDFGGAARVLGQRVVSAGEAGLLAAHRGEPVQVLATDGRPLAEGTLVAVDANGLGIRGANGRVAYVRDYARVEFAEGSGSPGSTLQVAVDGKAGAAPASLTYPTSGLGWRAAYSALLLGEDGCRLRLEALASIANRSGRDYAGARLKLVAGSPNFAKYDHGPRVMMMKAAAPAPAPESAPEQSALGDYRAYAIDGALDLPDASVTQVPLYASNELACERRWLYENGGTWFPPRPMLERDAWQAGGGPVQSQISFVAAENMPAGHLRVLVRDRDGRTELLGENRIADVGKGRDVQVDLGVAFDLGAKRERTTFKLDKAARELDEGLRITLDNRGERARTVTVREHPNRWRAWSLVSSSIKPAKQSPDLLEFLVAVPGGGTATLDYVVKYRWSPNED
ncbi:DUF4139 domain-containing protein [Dokdonella fugitiva]|uniref:DUF4139 domain-containing protein n=1 Tax=Dokdonella fugitiva TaxID=328517 RepID=UPI0015F9C737|nr:DUF4139 domain-containing protein [Dokdonella fugitiva]MBA8883896.1 hypothetical protein [Dokdonella fugitiva]